MEAVDNESQKEVIHGEVGGSRHDGSLGKRGWKRGPRGQSGKYIRPDGHAQ